MNVKLGVCNHIVPGSGVFAPKFVAEAGLDGMSLEFGNYDKSFPLSARRLQEAYLEAAAQYGIEYPNIGMSCFDFIPFCAHKGHAMYTVVRKAVTDAIDAAEFMGVPMVFIPTFGVSEILTEDQFVSSKKLFRFACQYAADKGITIAAENTMDTARQIRLYEEVNNPNFGLFYDSNNLFHDKGYDQVQMLNELYEYLVPQLHVKDGKNGVLAGSLLGTGQSSFYEVIDVLKRRGFEGWIISENLYEHASLRSLNADVFAAFFEDVRILKEAIM